MSEWRTRADGQLQDRETQEIKCDVATNMDNRKGRKTDRKLTDQREAGSHLMLFINF